MRKHGWQRAILDVVAKHRALPFAWGTSDCSTVPLEAIIAITGSDPWPGMHDYDSRLSAARCLAVLGYRDLADAFVDKLPEVHVAFAQRGDVGVIRDEATDTLCGALFLATGVAAKTENGLHIFTRDRVERAFRVE